MSWSRPAVVVSLVAALGLLLEVGGSIRLEAGGADGARGDGPQVVLTWPTPDDCEIPTPADDVQLQLRLHESDGDPLARLELRRNGHPVVMRTLQRAGDLTLPAVELRPGDNRFELVVETHRGQQAELVFDWRKTRGSRQLPAFSADGETVWSGDITVADDVVIPAGHTVHVTAGTVLRFAADAGIDCRGRLISEGAEGLPVWFVAQDRSWGNVLVRDGGRADFRFTHWRDAGGRPTAWQDNQTRARPLSSSAPTDGGALAVLGGTVMGARCSFARCVARSGGTTNGCGGAIFAERATVELTDCRFDRNMAARDGGAIYVFQAADVDATGCRLTANRAGRDGGAIAVLMNTDAIFDGCTLRGNRAVRNGGGAVVNVDGIARFTACRLVDNEAGGTGAGALVVRNQRADFHLCRFVGNHAGVEGGGCTVHELATADLQHCRFVDNRAGATGGALTICNSAPALGHCEVTDNRVDGQAGAGGIAIRYGTLTTGERYDGTRIDSGEMLKANTVAGNHPHNLTLDASE